MRKVLFLVLLLTSLTACAFSQNFNADFKQLVDKNDSNGQAVLLKKWGAAKPDDPELFVAYFNHYIGRGRNEVLTLSPASKIAGGAVLAEGATYDEKNYKLALFYIDKGIAKFPDRLDMRFGKTYLLGENRDYVNFTAEIVKTIDRSNENKNHWLWMENKPVKDPQKFMLNSIQDYVGQLFDSGDEQVDYIKTVAEAALRYYPDSVENLSDLAVYYIFREKYDDALAPLLKAEKLAPADVIVLNNIATCYEGKADKENAIKYFEMVIKNGDEKAKVGARQRIAKLKGNQSL